MVTPVLRFGGAQLLANKGRRQARGPTLREVEKEMAKKRDQLLLV